MVGTGVSGGHDGHMSTVVLGEPPAELEALLARRRALGLDGHDEVWAGAHHVAPHAHSDHGIVEAELAAARAKFGFYAARGVRELLVADPAEHTVGCRRLVEGAYEPADASEVLAVDMVELSAEIDWL